MSSADKKAIVLAEKKRIQDELHDYLGVTVDAPKPGSGSTNDGNTARKFFNNIDIVSTVTGEKFSSLI